MINLGGLRVSASNTVLFHRYFAEGRQVSERWRPWSVLSVGVTMEAMHEAKNDPAIKDDPAKTEVLNQVIRKVGDPRATEPNDIAWH
jgi:hypothetical protein